MSHHATQTSLPLSNNVHELRQLQEENQLLHGKIRGYVTLGNLLLEKKEECQTLQEENKALREKLESIQKTSQSSSDVMENEIEKQQTVSTKDKNQTATPGNVIQHNRVTEHFPSYIHNQTATLASLPEDDPTQAKPVLDDKMPTQESLEFENHSTKNRSTRTSESASSFERIDPTPSGSLFEIIPNQAQMSDNLNRQLSTKVNYSSSNSFNLMEFPSVTEANQVISSPQEELFDPLIVQNSNEAPKEEETILSIKVSQVAVAMDLTTDGPAEKMRKFLEELVPEIEKQEEDTKKFKTCNLALKEELELQKSQNRRLLQKIQQLEHQVNNLSPSSSLSSQTQVLDWEQHRHTETQKIENGRVSGREQETIEKYQKEIQKWRDLFSQWTRDKEKLKAETDQLKEEITSYKSQDQKRQEEFDKILLNAKERTTEAEARREDLQQRLDRQVIRVEALEAEIYQDKEVITRLNREKSALEAEVTVLRGTGSTSGLIGLTEGPSREDLKQENAVLREQLTVFKEDFDRERSDRAHAQSVKDDLRKQMEADQRKVRTLQDQLKGFERQLRSAEKNVKQTMTENVQLHSENQKLKKELQREKEVNSQQQYYHQMTSRPPMGEYLNPYRGQPESDPMAQPVAPYLFQTGRHQNASTEYSRPQMTNKAQLCPEQLPGAWNCPNCTYTNHPSRTVCEICGSVFTREQLQNFYQQNANQSQHLMARGDTMTPVGEDPPDLCTDSGLKPVNCH
ncbi:TNFAIP3-interacting protein 1-like [Ostrea edulis]|uniref:TNFAIP3-interacting protein 1-like n=1 Tax=Ostrea edulis TaxID=37623 RepID=UPI0024AEB4FB|nr:TNFAIP3-interacting protein 1-like [Ostrea edulis]XP_048760262.2 TNFAIP3-interacting protein 1-like [Ostrea edulis]XP_048760264.2 TNFAIP3-interacting protein 1-like [Ostrea edulis]XP_056018370.1 TNFAIP3-interacting protein 1-like [Ostrea edulis]XP_056018371.1 TNFAIP3-interacting protein 1-like [Ostrea edulis]